MSLTREPAEAARRYRPPIDVEGQHAVELATGRTDLRSVVAALRRQQWLILAAAGLALVAGLALSALTPSVYQAQAEILIEPDVPADDPQFTGRALFQPQELETQAQLLTSDVVLRRATDALEVPRGAADDVEALLLDTTRVLVLSARAGDPELAADLATAISEEYLALRRERATEALTASRDEAERALQAATEDVERIDERIAQGDVADNRLNAERYAAVEAVHEARDRLAHYDASIEAQTGGGQIIEPATVPDGRISPQPLRNGVVALLLGLGLGVVVGLVRDTFDEAVRTDDDVLDATGGPILGRVPSWPDAAPAGVTLLRDPGSAAAEAYRDVRANLGFACAEACSVTIASPGDGEGKSSLAANLAVASSLAGFDVALVDGDLRRPSLHRLFGVSAGTGLAEVLAGDARLEEACTTLDASALTLVTAGRIPDNPSELMGSQRLVDALHELSLTHDRVFVDTPPAMAAADAQEVASLTDATVVVVERARTGARSLREATERLTRAGANHVGVVVNRADPRLPYDADHPGT